MIPESFKRIATTSEAPTLLKAKAREQAKARGLDLILSDGAPGVGCPVIASLAKASLALLVTEPTPSGLHNQERVADLCHHCRLKSAVLINKADLSPAFEATILAFAAERGIPVVGALPHDAVVTTAMVHGQAVTEIDTPFAQDVRQIWEHVLALLTSPLVPQEIRS